MRAGIIGTGAIARSHLEGYRKNGIIVKAIADVDTGRLENFAAEFGIAHTYSSGRELLQSGLANMVSVCTPPAFHETDAVAALENGVHVLCEKPLAHTMESARRIATAAETAGGSAGGGATPRFGLAFRHRFIPAIRKIRELVDTGRIGAPLQMYNHFAGYKPEMKDTWFADPAISGGGCLIDTTSHSIDTFRFLFGEITDHHAQLHTVQDGLRVEDTSVLMVQSVPGVIGILAASWISGDKLAYVDVVGTDGRIRFDYLSPDKVWLKQRGADNSSPTEKAFSVPTSDGCAEEIASLITAINEDRDPACSAVDGLRAAEIVFTEYGR